MEPSLQARAQYGETMPDPGQMEPPLLPNRDPLDLARLGWLHVVWAGASAGLWLLVYRFFSQPMVEQTQLANLRQDDPFRIVPYIVIVSGIQATAMVLLNLITAVALLRRSNRTIPLVASCLNIFSIPFGTALAIATFVVLMRPSAQELFTRRKSGA